jgi:hypothetical protein
VIDLRSLCAMQNRISITKVETWTKLEARLPPRLRRLYRRVLEQ